MADTKRTKVAGKDGEQPRTLDEVLAGLLLIAGPALIARLLRPSVNPPTRDPEAVPVPPEKIPGYFEGYQRAQDEAAYFIRQNCAACECPLCAKLRVNQ